jgi:L-ribulose-5-phosphate 3-epimerase UlaE
LKAFPVLQEFQSSTQLPWTHAHIVQSPKLLNKTTIERTLLCFEKHSRMHLESADTTMLNLL